MMRSKAEVDKHVKMITEKLPAREINLRSYSLARLYYDAGDYENCRRFVERYLSVRERDAAAHKLLAQVLRQLGDKEKALEQYKTSLDIDPTQTSLILDICTLLSDDELFIDPGRARYWCERAQEQFPRHPVTFNLRERLLAHSDPDPDALLRLLAAELQQRPRDAALHARLLKQHLLAKNYKEAFEHSFKVEISEESFRNNLPWYEVLAEVLALDEDGRKTADWRRQLLELTVAERLCALSLSDGPGESNRGLIETAAALHRYDLDIQRASAVANNGEPIFHSALLQHHRGQFCFYAACFLLKKAKKEQLNWKEAVLFASPLFLLAWHATRIDLDASWLTAAPDHQRSAARRWHVEASYRCSQAGHCLLAGTQEKNHSFIDRVSQFCSGNHWKDKVYQKIFTNRDQLGRSKSSYFLNAIESPTLRLPRRAEVQAYDAEAQNMFPHSLHHVVWMLLDYRQLSQFKCTLFEMLRSASHSYTNCGPETLSRLDVEAFAFAATLTALQHRKSSRQAGYQAAEVPQLLPACITDQLCSATQMKWWDCAVKVSRNEVGTELSDIRATLRRGIEVVRCVDSHGLDPQLLCMLAAIFRERAKTAATVDDKEHLETRAALYYSIAIPLLDKLKGKYMIRQPDNRMFEYSHNELSTKELTALIEESKLYMGEVYFNEGNTEKAVDTLTGLKSPESSLLVAKIYMKMAYDEVASFKDKITSEDRSKHSVLLLKAKEWACMTEDRLKCSPDDKLETEVLNLLEKIDRGLSRANLNISVEYDNQYSTEELSSEGSQAEPTPRLFKPGNALFRNASSTPKHRSSNSTHYKSAIDPTLLETSRLDRKQLERIETQIKSLYKKDSSMSSFVESTRCWIEENRHLGEEVRDLKNDLAEKIISRINTNIQDTVDQFKLLKLSVDQVKDKIGEYRDECKTDVTELKREVAELKKEFGKLKTSVSDPTIDESDLYNLEEYQASEATPAFNPQLAFNPTQVLPTFNQRVVPPVLPPAAYGLYGQSLYALYNQFSQLSQPPPVPPAPLFDPLRPVNYPGVFPPPEYPEQVPVVPSFPPPSVPPPMRAPPAPKEVPRSLPANVVITSSDQLPPRTSLPQPAMSVTIPPHHVKNSPHNYQIPLPTTAVAIGSVATTPVPAQKPFSGFGFNSATSTPTSATDVMPKICSREAPKFGIFEPPNSHETPKSALNLSAFNNSFASPNTSANKSRTLSEKSNTSVEYDPCPDFKAIIPLPDEVKVVTGEEDETAIFSARAKLYRFHDKQWKERGIGEMKLLKHNETGKVRVLMRREQIHKTCANHVITSELQLSLMKNETKAYVWFANDFADGEVSQEKLCVRFKTAEIGKEFYDAFEKSRKEAQTPKKPEKAESKKPAAVPKPEPTNIVGRSSVIQASANKTLFGGFTFSSAPTFKDVNEPEKKVESKEEVAPKPSIFSGFNFKSQSSTPFANILTTSNTESTETRTQPTSANIPSSQLNTSDVVEEFEPAVDFKPVVPLPELVEQKTGEEDEKIIFERRAKLLRFDRSSKEWKERGLGNMKILVQKSNDQKVRLLMRREIVMKVCCNHGITTDLKFERKANTETAITWCAMDFAEGEPTTETFCLRFKTAGDRDDFLKAIENVQSGLTSTEEPEKSERSAPKQVGFGDKFKPKPGSWSCKACYTNNVEAATKCIACETPKVTPEKAASKLDAGSPIDANIPVSVSGWGDRFKPKVGSWECSQCLIRNDAQLESCSACDSPKDPSKPKKDTKSILDAPTGAPKFSFGIPAATTDTTKSAVAAVPSAAKPLATAFTFGIPSASPAETTKAVDFSRTTPFQPKITTTPAKDTAAPFAKEHSTFSFVMKSKSPIKSPEKGEDSDNENYEEDEGHHIHFAPIVPLPAKVDVKTGEEEEQELYVQRAKLFRFVSSAGEWKERGIGNVKILKNRTTCKLRVVMRRDQVHKICLNHVLTTAIKYENKDEKSLLFTANDFSEGELAGWQQFCLRFKTKEIADEFKKAAEDALSRKLRASNNESVSVESSSSEEVFFVSETQATSEEKQKAKDLMLPENFYLYTRKPACKGCRGCEQNEVKTLSGLPTPTKMITNTALNLGVNTPAKSQFSPSPSNSVFVTPIAANRSSDVTIFQTPVGTSDDSRDGHNTSVDKENATPKSRNTTVVKPPLLATPKLTAETPQKSDPKSIFGAAENGGINQSMFKFGSTDTKQTEEKKSSLFGGKSSAPVFGNAVFGTTGAIKSDPNSIFSAATTQAGEAKPAILGSTQTTAIFGNAQAASIFGIAANQKGGSLFGSNEQKDAKSIFGATPGGAETKSIFGPVGQSTWGGLSDQKSIFGGQTPVFSHDDKKPEEKTEQKKTEVSSIFGGSKGQVFGTGAQNAGSLFDTAPTNGTPTFGTIANAAAKTPNLFSSLANTDDKTTVSEEAPVPFTTDNPLTFAAIKSNGPGFTKKDNFKWEGAGQQLFGAAAKSKNNQNKDDSKLNKTEEEETHEGGEEEYDPHYEPIVPLPDKIIVTTGEEDEEKLFGERSKLFRYDEKGHEWKERGVGEIKLLYHPQRRTYRLLLRRDQVYKLVLNMLMHKDLELLPLKNSETAWTFAAQNYAEASTGETETLACKFKNKDLAVAFKDKVDECVRKLQVADAKAYRAKQEGSVSAIPAPAAPAAPGAPVVFASPPVANQQETDTTDHAEQVHYEYDEDYDEYYNEDSEDGSQVVYEAPGAAHVSGGAENADADEAVVQLLFDAEACVHKLLVVDAATGEILADTLVAPEMPAQVVGDTVRWTGAGYDEQELTVSFELSDVQEAARLYDAVATVKAEMENEDEHEE